jgi:hypothetical protein
LRGTKSTRQIGHCLSQISVMYKNKGLDLCNWLVEQGSRARRVSFVINAAGGLFRIGYINSNVLKSLPFHPSMSSASESPTASLSITPPAPKKNKPAKDKKGRKKKDQRKNEGIDLNWAYAPPPGAILIEEDVGADAGEFDWDKINDDDDLELCLIRVPESVSVFVFLDTSTSQLNSV